jgi:hypothetical protein
VNIVGEAAIVTSGKLQVRLMDQRGRLQRVVLAFPAEVSGGNSVQTAV